MIVIMFICPDRLFNRSTRHRELLSWMVDQMRLDHVPPSASSTLASNSDSIESAPRMLSASDFNPRFTIRMRRNAENSAAGDNAPATSAAAANSGSGNNPATPQTNPRVIVPGINPLPQNRMQQNQRDQVSNHIFHSFI